MNNFTGASPLAPSRPQPMTERGHWLAGRVAVVTGASRGIGAATAEAVAEVGTHVVLAARDSSALNGQVVSRAVGGQSMYSSGRLPDSVIAWMNSARSPFEKSLFSGMKKLVDSVWIRRYPVHGSGLSMLMDDFMLRHQLESMARIGVSLPTALIGPAIVDVRSHLGAVITVYAVNVDPLARLPAVMLHYFDAKRSILAAMMKSFSVRPPAEWVVNVTTSLPQLTSKSGWWPCDSASKATWVAKAKGSRKVVNSKVRRITRLASRFQRTSSCRLRSAARASSRVGVPEAQSLQVRVARCGELTRYLHRLVLNATHRIVC